MSDPALVILDDTSVPRVLMSGNELLEFKLPLGSRVLYPRQPLKPEANVVDAVRRAIDNPVDGVPLRALIRAGMRVTIAVDAQLAPCLQAGSDVSAAALEVLLPLLQGAGAEARILVATGIHRRLQANELRHLLGDRIYRNRDQLNVELHDPEASGSMVELGRTRDGVSVTINRSAAESDLLITVALAGHPQTGGYTTCALGLGGYANARAAYAPRDAEDTGSEHAARLAALHHVVADAIPIFAIEFTLDSRHFAHRLDIVRRNEDDLTTNERLRLRTLQAATRRLPTTTATALLCRTDLRTGVTGIYAGHLERVHERALARYCEQHEVVLGAQADVLVMGLGPHGPFNASAPLNPLLVAHMAQAWRFAQCRSEPLVKAGGTLILLHPCTDRFDHEQHTPHIPFVRQLLAETSNSYALHTQYEAKLARDPALLEMFRTGRAFHPAHAFMLWYQCEPARRHLGRVIVVGADNEYIPERLGFETAPNLDEALYRARNGCPGTQSVLCLHNFPTAVGRVVDPRSLS